MSIIKQAVGIDVSSEKIDCVYGTIDRDQVIVSGKNRVFKNTGAGFAKFTTWLSKQQQSDIALVIVMEATEVYYEALAYYLDEEGYSINVIQPNKMKSYARSLSQKSKTDALDAKMILQYGLERKSAEWHRPEAESLAIRQLTRERHQLQKDRTALKNQLHAHGRSKQSMSKTIKRLESRLRLLEKQLGQIEKELRAVLESDTDSRERFECMTSIQGIGQTTAAAVLAETGKFAQVERGNQLSSYAGLDPVHRSSGKYKGKDKISLKGNSHLRRILYMPAVAAIRCNPQMKAFYQRLLLRKEHKRTALIAVMRKLLLLMWTLWKTKTKYDSAYGLP